MASGCRSALALPDYRRLEAGWSRLEHKQFLIEEVHRRPRINAAGRALLKLFPESLPVRIEILERLTFFRLK
jgi:hypothetical protein